CNFTNLHCDPTHFISANPNFCISALSRYTQWDFIALVEKHGIAYHEKTLGQLFCDNSSRDIVAMLKAECDTANVSIVTDAGISEVSHTEGRFRVKAERGLFGCESLVIATGGLSIPKMGASDFGYRLARQFGLNVLPTRAGLVPFTFSGAVHELTSRLSGVSIPAAVSARDAHFAEGLLFTHRGLSGPAPLQVSSYWRPGDSIDIDLLPTIDAEQFLTTAKSAHPRQRLRSVLLEVLPKALVAELQSLLWPDIADTPLAEVATARLGEIANALHNWQLKPAATEGYRTAEVTLAGIDTDEVSSKTMQCHKQPGLFCIGEVLDVTGHLGGFNFQWAWASGVAAGNVV
ncbi:MAG: NAD(P)/FAD-dependent oxidoreductase, partial [Pseudomonadota bacterium]